MGMALLWVMIATICTGAGALLVKMTWLGALGYWLSIFYAQVVVTMIYGWVTTRRAK